MAEVFFRCILLFCCLVLLYSVVFAIWNHYNDHLFDKNGQDAIATVIQKGNGSIQYDVEYQGSYYRNRIKLTKSSFRSVVVGERFHARVLPDKLKYHHDNGITPRYVKIILVPLPSSEQNIEEEVKRINKMYNYKNGKESNKN